MYTYIYTYIYIHMHIYIYIYIYIYILHVILFFLDRYIFYIIAAKTHQTMQQNKNS